MALIPVRGFKWTSRSRRIAALVCAFNPEEKAFPLYVGEPPKNVHGRFDRTKFEEKVLAYLETILDGMVERPTEIELAILGQRVKGMMFPDSSSVEVQLENPSLN